MKKERVHGPCDARLPLYEWACRECVSNAMVATVGTVDDLQGFASLDFDDQKEVLTKFLDPSYVSRPIMCRDSAAGASAGAGAGTGAAAAAAAAGMVSPL
jgi:hypothetical protein